MSTPRPPISPDGAQAMFRQALRFMLWLLAGLLVVGVVVGSVVAGWPGVWSAVVGVALALVFSGTTVLSVQRTAGRDPAQMVMVVMGAWLGKVAVVFVALVLLSRAAFVRPMVLGLVLLAGVVGSAVLDYRAVSAARITYVDDAVDGTRDEGHAQDGRLTGGE